MSAPRISLIVAMAENRCIGRDNAMPWHVPEDLKRFKALTMGKPVVMGRKTFESILAQLGKPLPGRESIVVSRGGFAADGAQVYDSLDAALACAVDRGGDEIFIAGGAQIYALALPRADRLYLTRIHETVAGDAFFPVLDETQWRETAREDRPGSPPFSLTVLDRFVPLATDR